jgi:hypothetical protein
VGEIRSAQVVLFYLFDIAESVELSAVPPLIGGSTVAARLTPKPPTPAYVQYDRPPLLFDGEPLCTATLGDFHVRFRVYDYGVLSIALTRPVTGTWADLTLLSQTLVENDEMEARAETLATGVIARLRRALAGHHDIHLREDYLVVLVHVLETPQTSVELLAAHGAEIAAIVRGERQPLSDQELEAVLGQRLSYLDDDLVVPTWNAAFVYDTPAGAQAALEILEFANSQLLQFRYYDERLDAELASIYARVQKPRWFDQWIGSRHTRNARQIHTLFIDATEITDRTANAIKFTGDIYAARLFNLVAGRLGLDDWKANVDRKLKTLDDIYRFAVEQSSMARGQLLELMVVLILVFELVLLLAGIMR